MTFYLLLLLTAYAGVMVGIELRKERILLLSERLLAAGVVSSVVWIVAHLL